MWIDPNTQAVYRSHPEIRAARPDVSFPAVMTDVLIAEIGLLDVAQSPEPEYDPSVARVEESAPAIVDGAWVQQWSVVDLTEAEIADRLLAKREAMEVTPFQAYEALAQAGLLDSMEAFMADPNTPASTVMAWNKTTTFRRLSPTIAYVAGAMGWTDQQLDDLFEAAALIES